MNRAEPLSSDPFGITTYHRTYDKTVPHPFRITVAAKSGEAEKFEGEFPDDDWNRLSRYLACSFRLAECRIVESQSQLHFGISSTSETVVHNVSLPPEDDIAAFLLRLRPFVLTNEDTNFYGIRNLLARHMTLPSVRSYLDTLRDRYQGKAMPFQLKVGSTTGETVVNSEKAVLTWLNAFEYHQDADKQAELRAMYSVFPELSSRAMFLYTLLECAAAIGKMGAFIDGLSKREGRQVSV
jgi:hypothetical protein